MAKAKAPQIDAELGVPNDWLPIFEWAKWFYPKQEQFTRSLAENFETMFKAGNGAGKTRILYWNILTWALGIHPYMAMALKEHNNPWGIARGLPAPPLRFKILVTDFEHGLDKVAMEILTLSTAMPDGSVIGPMLPQSCILQTPTKDDKTFKIRAGNGSVSQLFFMTSEQKRKLHSGTNFDALFCDEEPIEKVYDESKRGLRNAKGGGRIAHSFTPPLPEDITMGPSWTRHKIFLPFKEGKITPPSLRVIEASMRDNPAITEEFIGEFSRGKTEEELRVQIEGDYPRWGKLVHPGFEDTMWDPKTCKGHLLPRDWSPPESHDEVKVEFALDWHRSKPPVALWTYEDHEGNIIVLDEITPEMGKDKSISQTADIIRQMEGHPYPKYRKVYRLGDPKMKDRDNSFIAGFNAWQEFRNNGIILNEAYNKQPEVGISVVNDFLAGNTKDHPRLFVKENCEYTRLYMREHYWARDKNGNADPDPKWSDYPICIRYIVQRKARKAKKGMYRRNNVWGLTSYDGVPGYGPYNGQHLREQRY